MKQQSLLVSRLSIGLAQGIWLYFLYQALDSKIWPATDGYIFAPLLVIGGFVPLIAISGLGNLRLRTLLIWLGIATVLCAGIAFYDIYRMPLDVGFSRQQPRALPEFAIGALMAILFIIHTLIVAGEADRRWVATYPTHFDIAWKHGVQALLAPLFVGVFWIILLLGAGLFELIKIKFFTTLIQKPSFWIPATSVGFAYALQLTDVRTELVRSTRTLLLLLLSWLLPVMTILVIGFLLALPFAGLETLWNTKFAANLLLVSSAALIVLVNAVHQDGRSAPATILRYSSLLVPVALVALVTLAAYASMLRIAQYGWTPDRVLLVACIVVAACYAIGYSYAAIRSGLSLERIEPVNLITGSVVILGILIALNTPIADPLRISVASQVARLESGHIAPEKFDYTFLLLKAGRFGREALNTLSKKQEGPGAAVIAASAKKILEAKTWSDLNGQNDRKPLSVADRLANITVVYPKGAKFPVRLLEQDWTTYHRPWQLPLCIITEDAKCDAMLIDLDNDGKDEVLLLAVLGHDGAFKMENGKWDHLGMLAIDRCQGPREALQGIRDALSAGQIETVAAPKDIRVGQWRIHINAKDKECPPPPAAPSNTPARTAE